MTRIGVISDVHANHAALRRALEVLADDGAESIVCAGDVVGYGPEPNECIATLVSIGAMTVAGNHDRMSLGALDADDEGRFVRESTKWTTRRLGKDALAFLGGLPEVLTLGEIVVAHGSLRRVDEYVNSKERADEQLAMLARDHPAASMLVLGHTHRQMLHSASEHRLVRARGGEFPLVGGPVVLNPGSVGQSRQVEALPHARFALVDIGGAQVHFYAHRYDVQRARATVRENQLPREVLHLVPGRYAAVARNARVRSAWGATAR